MHICFFTRLVKINSIYKSNDDKLFDRVENIVGKGENACCQHFLHSLKVASLSGWLELGFVITNHSQEIHCLFLQDLQTGKLHDLKLCYIHMLLNPFPNKPWFLRVCSTSLLKTLWEKEKLLVTSNFSFSHSVFYLFEELSSIFVKFELSSAESFSLEEPKICRLVKG